jgi:transcriptional regulator with XRE-family HTH domain
MSKKLGNIIKNHREEKCLSIRDLARLMYVAPATVSRWETGDRIPDLEKLEALSVHLGISPQEILKGAEGISSNTSAYIIFVDDREESLKDTVNVAKRILNPEMIKGFTSAKEALGFARENGVGIAFIEMKLRGTSGIELAKLLIQTNSHTNIIFLTEHSEYMEDAWKVHASGYLLKPLDEDKLRDEIENLRFPIWGLLT